MKTWNQTIPLLCDDEQQIVANGYPYLRVDRVLGHRWGEINNKPRIKLIINLIRGNFVPRTGLEPVQTLRSKGFSYHYGLRHHLCLWSGLFLHREAFGSLGVSCLVSAPSSFQRLGSRLPSALPVKVSLNLRHSTSLFSESALKLRLSPSCLPFHHQGGRGANG